MNIKSLLLGSAVAAVAVTGARAADAIIIAEPEPLEYVRVCDTYGVGYFYIPGTETCLRIGGWLRYEIHANSNQNGWGKRARSRLEVNTRNESELGTVAGYLRLEHSHDSNYYTPANGNFSSGVTGGLSSAPAMAENFQYSVGVGGLEMGYRDSTWTRWFGYGGFTDQGGSYGYNKNHYISYTFSGDGFTGFVSLDHDNSNNYMPDLAAGVGGKFGNVEALATIGYDESLESVALRGKLNADFGGVQARLAGFYANKAGNRYWSQSTSTAKGWAEWSILVGLQAPVAERTTVAVDAQYFDGGDWRFVGNVNHQIATGLSALLEVQHDYRRFGQDETKGFLRFQRSF
jgi:hypothetical protein